MSARAMFASLLVAAALSLTACDGSSGGDEPATGNVAVVITDGPTGIYDRIEISLTEMILIGAGGQVELYNGPPITFNLLEMSEWGDLAFNSQVLAGAYNKIRLQITGITLYDDDAMGGPVPQSISNLPANGMIDLNPRGPFDVSPGVTTVIKVDIDAKRSFQAVQTGQGKVQFRPIIFVDVYQDDSIPLDRLVRAFGTVQEGSIDIDSFRLCDLQFISQTAGSSPGSPGDCIRVHADSLPSPGIFEADGTESTTGFPSVADGQLLTAIGFIVGTEDPGAYLGLQAVVLEIGDRTSPDGWDTTHGSVRSAPGTTCGTDCLDFDPSADDPTATTVVTRMQPGTKVYRADGAPLMQTDVTTDDSGSVDGLLDSGTGELLAALVVLTTDTGGEAASGTVDAVSSIMGTSPDEYFIVTIATDAGSSMDICVAADTAIAEVIVDDGVVTILDGMLDIIELQMGDRIEAYADTDPAPDPGCEFLAARVIVEPVTTP